MPPPSSRDPAEDVARIAATRRELLLRVNRRRLRWEDLEDCYSQATLELLARARRAPFASTEHIQHALEQKFSSRIDDRRRAIGGRSPIETALASALPVDSPAAGAAELEDRSAGVVRQVVARTEVRRLREVAAELSEDQRLVLACQIGLGMDCAEFCERFGWSSEKFRKVAQRARARLRALVDEYQLGERCRRLEPDLLALAAGVATAEQQARAEAHLENCVACARHTRALERVSRRIAGLLPLPVAKAGVLAKLGGAVALALRRVVPLAGHGGAEAGAAGGSVLGAGALKFGVAAACLAGAAGGYAICTQLPPIAPGSQHRHAHVARPHARAASFTPATVPRAPRRATARVAPAAPQPRRLARGRVASAQAHREFGHGAARAAALQRHAPASAATRRTRAQSRAEFGFEH
jgi:DNA-directed RNA polymerase specialized sigma24 family protein